MRSQALIRPTDLLRCEHATIMGALEKLEALTGELSRGDLLQSERASALTAFLVSYLENFHLEKEERLLFPALRDAGMPEHIGPLPVLLGEHEKARHLLRVMVEAVAGGLDDAGEFVAAADEFVGLMRVHIRKENGALFIAAEDLLDDRAKLDLLEAFRARGTHRPFIG